jgi:hypothetical protein
MVIVASSYLTFYIEVGGSVCTFLPTLTPPKIPFDSNATALIKACIMENIEKGYIGRNIYILSDSQAAIKAHKNNFRSALN